MSEQLNKIRARMGRSLLPLMLLAMFPLAALPAESAPSEYAIKAALIYKLSKFVEWPEITGTDEEQQFGICVLGADPFRGALEMLSGETVHGTEITIGRAANVEDIGEDCRVVFISSSKERFLELIVEDLAARPILTIGEMRNFARQGGMVQLTADGRRINFTINLDSARRANLLIAAPLLELSTVLQEAD